VPVENLLTIASGGTGLSYDPELRLYEVAGGGAATRFAYDGLNAIAEYDASNALQRRYVFDDRGNPVIWYEGADLSQRRFLAQGELGCVITVTDSAANPIAINTYDEYGIPSATNIGRFQYTGQMWIGEAGAYYYKNRMYSPGPGRFNQTDPMGYGGDGPNLYAYVLNDPVNRTDPFGLFFLCKMVSITSDDFGWAAGPRCYDNGIELSRQPAAEPGGRERDGEPDVTDRNQPNPCDANLGQFVSAAHAATSLLGAGTSLLGIGAVIVAAPEIATGLGIASGILLAGELATDAYYIAHGNPNPALATGGGLIVGKSPALARFAARVTGEAIPRFSKPLEALTALLGGQLGGIVSSKSDSHTCKPVL
jgi:RHS repeat-associated protein